jgi:hypothetical protein
VAGTGGAGLRLSLKLNAMVVAAATTATAALGLATQPAFAQWTPDMGKLRSTAGVSQIEGAGGGGLAPWAMITGYGTRDSYGANAHYTTVRTQDVELSSYGAAIGIADRVEISLDKQEFSSYQAPLDRLRIDQDILGIKLKLTGDIVYDQDRWMPQLAIGVMAKRNNGVRGLAGISSVQQLGARRESGIDYYLAASKLLLDQSLLLNLTLRLTKANQMGILGFGGDLNDGYRLMPEASVAYLLNRSWVAGLEYRMKPHNLSADPEKDYADAFIAYLPNKYLSVTLAAVTLGDITVFNPRRQNGVYLSLQSGF